MGAHFAKPPASILPGLLPVNAQSGNATLTFTDGLLSLPLSKSINISSVATRVPATDPSFAISLIASTGFFSGTFDRPNSTRPSYAGVMFLKGADKGGFGYFLTMKPKVIDGLGQSGQVVLKAQTQP